MRLGSATTATCCVLAGTLAHAASVSILPGTLLSQEASVGTDQRQVTALPYQTVSSLSGASGLSTVAYDLEPIHFDVDLQHASSSSAFYGRSSGLFNFSVDEPTQYSLQTTFDGSGALAWGGYIDLVDVTTGQSLLRREMSNGLTVLPTESDGPAGNSGFVSGVLQPGHAYEFTYILASIASASSADALATVPNSGIVGPGGLRPIYQLDVNRRLGQGSLDAGINFSMETFSVVPLPASVWSGLALLTAIAGVRVLGYVKPRLRGRGML